MGDNWIDGAWQLGGLGYLSANTTTQYVTTAGTSAITIANWPPTATTIADDEDEDDERTDDERWLDDRIEEISVEL